MKKLTRIIALYFCASAIGCSKSDDAEKVTNPTSIASPTVSIAGWWLYLPTEGTKWLDLRERHIDPSQAVEAGPISFGAKDGDGRLHGFSAKLRADACEAFKTAPVNDELSGSTEADAYWFLSNEKKEFKQFQANVRHLGFCLALTITPDDSVSQQNVDSELIRYFRLMVESAKFERTNWLDENDELAFNFKAPNIGPDSFEFSSDQSGIKRAAVSSPFISSTGSIVSVKESVAIGSCNLTDFAIPLQDNTRKSFSPTLLEVATYQINAESLSSESSKLNVNGIYKMKSTDQCMLIDFQIIGGREIEQDNELKDYLVSILVNPDIR